MGELSEENASNALSGLSMVFSELLEDMLNIDMYKIRVLILALAQFIYCKYFTFGKKSVDKDGNDRYDIDAKTMELVYSDEVLQMAAKKIIYTRNAIGHDINSDTTNRAIASFKHSKGIKRLLEYESLLDKDGHYIEPVGGEYSLYDLRPDIKMDMNPQDIAKRMMGNNPFKAAGIMSGDK